MLAEIFFQAMTVSSPRPMEKLQITTAKRGYHRFHRTGKPQRHRSYQYREVKAITDGTVDTLLADAIDMHVHGSPDVLPRKLHDIDIARRPRKADLLGIAEVSSLSHGSPRISGTAVHTGDCCLWCVVLNRNVGGLNPFTVETKVKLGAKEVWLPRYHQ